MQHTALYRSPDTFMHNVMTCLCSTLPKLILVNHLVCIYKIQYIQNSNARTFKIPAQIVDEFLKSNILLIMCCYSPCHSSLVLAFEVVVFHASPSYVCVSFYIMVSNMHPSDSADCSCGKKKHATLSWCRELKF